MKHQSGPEEAPPPPSPVAGWASGFFRAILSILATAEEDYAEADVTVHAAPGLATLLDIAMYRSREAELTSVTCSANSLLAALFDLKRLAGSMLSEARAAGGGEHARAFASACLEQADEAIDRLTMEGLAGTANLDPAGPGGAGAADLAKALASGQCGLTKLDLRSESAPYVGEASVLGSVR